MGCGSDDAPDPMDAAANDASDARSDGPRTDARETGIDAPGPDADPMDARADAPEDASPSDAGEDTSTMDAEVLDADAPDADAEPVDADADADAIADADADADPPIPTPSTCFSYTQGASGYAGTSPRLALGGGADFAQVWIAGWTGTPASLFARFGGSSGGFGSTNLTAITGTGRSADVARNGAEFAAVFTSQGADATNWIHFARFDAMVMAGAVTPIAVTAGSNARIVRGAAEYGMVWAAPSQSFVRVSDDGAVLGSAELIGGRPLLVAFVGGEYGVVYVQTGSTASDMMLARFSATTGAPVGSPVVLVSSSRAGALATATSDGYALHWYDDVAGGLGANALARFDASGAMLWKVASSTSADAIAWSGTELAMIYFTTTGSGLTTSATAHLRRFTADGEAILPHQQRSMGLADPNGSAHLVWSGGGYSFGVYSDPDRASSSNHLVIECFAGTGT